MPFKTLARLGKPRPKVVRQVEAAKVAVTSPKEIKPNLFDSVFSVIKERRSVRKYSNKAVSDDILEKLMVSAMHAPSAGNQQPWEFIIVRDFEIRKHIAEAAFNQDWMLEAPVFIVACTNMQIAAAVYGERGERLYSIQSVATAIENILLAAQSLGLSTCWVGAFSEPRVAILLHCPNWVRPCAIITLGYGTEKPHKPVRQPMSEIAHIERFGNKWK